MRQKIQWMAKSCTWSQISPHFPSSISRHSRVLPLVCVVIMIQVIMITNVNPRQRIDTRWAPSSPGPRTTGAALAYWQVRRLQATCACEIPKQYNDNNKPWTPLALQGIDSGGLGGHALAPVKCAVPLSGGKFGRLFTRTASNHQNNTQVQCYDNLQCESPAPQGVDWGVHALAPVAGAARTSWDVGPTPRGVDHRGSTTTDTL